MPNIMLRHCPFRNAIKPISQNRLIFYAFRKGKTGVSLKNHPAEKAHFVVIRFLFHEFILSKYFTTETA